MSDNAQVLDMSNAGDVDTLEEKDEEKKTNGITVGKLAMYAESGLLNTFSVIDFKASTAIIVGKLLKSINAELQSRNEQRKRLGEKFGEKITSDDGESWRILPPSQGGDAEKWKQFRDQLLEVDAMPVKLGGTTLRPADLKNSSGKEADLSGAAVQMLFDLKLLKE